MSPPQGTGSRPLDATALRRTIGQLTVGVTQAIEETRQRLDNYRLAEVEVQLQIPIGGDIGGSIQWAQTTVAFSEVFPPPDASRDSPYDEPQFSCGYRHGTGVFPVVMGMVEAYVEDDGIITGARLRIGAFTPNVEDEGKQFKGTLHVTFQGYGAPDDDEGHAEDAGES